MLISATPYYNHTRKVLGKLRLFYVFVLQPFGMWELSCEKCHTVTFEKYPDFILARNATLLRQCLILSAQMTLLLIMLTCVTPSRIAGKKRRWKMTWRASKKKIRFLHGFLALWQYFWGSMNDCISNQSHQSVQRYYTVITWWLALCICA